MRQEYLDMIRQVLDHEVIDANNMPCGMVDDLEIEGGPGEALKVTALLVGPDAWAERLPSLFGLLAKKIFGNRRTRVPWDEVSVITEKIQLKSTASALGLGEADRKAAKWIRKLPGA
jgi:sporulation protein YlmC with PRC-barrel domain